MDEPRERWQQVGEELADLGRKLRQHVDEVADGEREEAGEEVRRAVQSVTDAVDRAFTALDNAARDDEVRTDVREVGRSLRDALDATFSNLGDQLRSRAPKD